MLANQQQSSEGRKTKWPNMKVHRLCWSGKCILRKNGFNVTHTNTKRHNVPSLLTTPLISSPLLLTCNERSVSIITVGRRGFYECLPSYLELPATTLDRPVNVIVQFQKTASAKTLLFHWFTQPPMRRIHICFTDVFFSVFFLPSKKYQTTVLGNGWTDFHETFTKR